ncbi:hypothetical protein KDD17_09030 [Sulfitobacter albidus]|uniref:Capsule polysaccharide biosynthesis protein n=1 Tax=Sulfitobacter albidus TaxID=2829501 RepID=A0A975PLG6_9RHOB|nr:hypothetical protein [Sulfitobacter albidus]QUJ75170.1 hypothetical protein KDD17_09030 [Sulfitobacter albidus]
MRFVFHLPGSWLGPGGSGLMPFYRKLVEGLSERGIPFELRKLDRDTVLDQVAADDAFHVVNHGAFAHPRLRNVGLAYIYPFWHVDPQGIRAASSIAAREFDPRDTDADAAQVFFKRLRGRLVIARQSRYPQPQEAVDLPRGVAVFLQSEAHRGVEETAYIPPFEMVEAVCRATDAPVMVKLHPLDKDRKAADRLDALATAHPHLHIVSANIHDMIAAARHVVTINSAVGIEAYLHRKPVILCGQSDFHHIATVAHTADDMAEALNAPVKLRPYDKYIHWYFAQNCLSTTEPALIDRFIARFEDPSA